MLSGQQTLMFVVNGFHLYLYRGQYTLFNFCVIYLKYATFTSENIFLSVNHILYVKKNSLD